jgi:hypothetical protein
LESRIGKEVDVQCIGGAFSGKVVKVEGMILALEKDERTCYIDIEKIVALMDKPDKKIKSPGFLPQA